MYPFSPEVLAGLKDAGWTEERRIDTTEYQRLLEAEGYPISPAAMEFLSRFGELRIIYRWGTFHFCLREALVNLIRINVEADMDNISLPLTPIGDAYWNMMAIVMDPTGQTYISFSGLHDLGISGEDAIEALCTGRPIQGMED